MSCVYAVPEYLRIFDQLLEAALSVFDALSCVIKAVEDLLISVRAQLLTAIDSVFDDFGHIVYPVRHFVPSVSETRRVSFHPLRSAPVVL